MKSFQRIIHRTIKHSSECKLYKLRYLRELL